MYGLPVSCSREVDLYGEQKGYSTARQRMIATPGPQAPGQRGGDGLTSPNMKSLITVTASVLAGFTLPTITLLITADPKNLPPAHEAALELFVVATGLLIWSVQVAALARQNSKKTIYVAAVIYAIGLIALVTALGFLLWPGRDGATIRIVLVVILGLLILGGTLVVVAREYWGELSKWRPN